MPQASDEQRALMTRWFGDISDDGPWSFLKTRGYTERQGWIFKPTPAHTISEYEGECIDFLCDEWDWAFNNPQPAVWLGRVMPDMITVAV